MGIQKQLDKLKNLYPLVLDYIDNEEDLEEHFEILCNFIKEQQFTKNGEEFKLILHLLVSLSNNHYRVSHFFEKIERILIQYKKVIQKHYSNKELFAIFESNQRLLLFLIKEKMLIFDEFIRSKTISYEQYFIPEIKKLDGENQPFQLPEDYDEKRKIGENDNEICELIRNDLIEEFIIYVNKNDYPLKGQIMPSIYETNSFLLMSPPTLIEYSAFFGSCSIFKYLFHNGAEIKPSIWAYAVHSNNQEMIDLLEKNQIKLNEYDDDDDNNEEEEEEIFPFKESVLKSIAYHNNDTANFILNKYEKEKAKKSKNRKYKYKIEKLIISKAFQNYNFAYFPDNIKNNDIFFYLCIYDYVPLVKTFISTRKINIETIRVI